VKAILEKGDVQESDVSFPPPYRLPLFSVLLPLGREEGTMVL
jgi:hypothetical protein